MTRLGFVKARRRITFPQNGFSSFRACRWIPIADRHAARHSHEYPESAVDGAFHRQQRSLGDRQSEGRAIVRPIAGIDPRRITPTVRHRLDGKRSSNDESI